jgi:hypothetical protein
MKACKQCTDVRVVSSLDTFRVNSLVSIDFLFLNAVVFVDRKLGFLEDLLELQPNQRILLHWMVMHDEDYLLVVLERFPYIKGSVLAMTSCFLQLNSKSVF